MRYDVRGEKSLRLEVVIVQFLNLVKVVVKDQNKPRINQAQYGILDSSSGVKLKRAGKVNKSLCPHTMFIQ